MPGNKILWIRKEIAPKEQFLLFSTIVLMYISNLRSQITYSFVKFGCSIGIFLNSANLKCLSTDISKCFRGSLRLQDNEFDCILYLLNKLLCIVFHCIAPGRVAQSVGHLTRKSGVLGSIPGMATYFRFSFRFFKKGSCQLLAKVCARSTG